MAKPIVKFAMNNRLKFNGFKLQRGEYNQTKNKYEKLISKLEPKWEEKEDYELINNYMNNIENEQINYICIRPGNKYLVVDIDSQKAYDEFMKEFPHLCDTTFTRSFNYTEECYYRIHYWFQITSENTVGTCINNLFGFDLLTGMSNIFEAIDTEFKNHSIKRLNNIDLQALYTFSENNDKPKKDKKEKIINDSNYIMNIDTTKKQDDKKYPSLKLLEFYIRSLPQADIPDYTEWLKLTWSISNSVSDENREDAWKLYKKYHSTSEKFNEQKDRKTFFRPEVDPNYRIYDFNYLKSFVRKYQGQNKITAEEIAVKIHDEYQDKIICQISDNKKIFKWFILDKYNKYSSKETELDNIIIETFKNENSKITIKALNDTKEFLKIYCQNDEIKFDENSFLLGFKTNVCDLKTGLFRKYTKEDRISLTTEYEYIQPTTEDINYYDSKLDQIFPIEEEKHYGLTSFASGLIGICIQHLFLLTGKGGNSKGVLCRMMEQTLGPQFCKPVNTSAITNELTTGPNPEVAKLDKVRFAFANEPNDHKVCNAETLKQLTGNDCIAARGLYDNDDEKCNHLTLALLCNNKPKLDKVDDAIERRIIAQRFRSSFNDKFTEVKKDYTKKEFEFPGDKFIDTPEFREKYKHAFMHILIGYCVKFINNDKLKIKKPDFIIKESESWFIQSSIIGSWFNENYKFNDQSTNFVKIIDLYDEIRKDDMYANLDRNEKKKCNKTAIELYFKNSPVYKKYYSEERKKKNGIDYFKYLIGFDKIEQEITNENNDITFSNKDELDGYE
jgi:phage/plasmid-associated DNA primase